MDGSTELFCELEDPRKGNAIRFSLNEVLLIAFAAMLCGAETCVDMERFAQAKLDFLREFLPLPHGAPSHDTFSRVFRVLDPQAFHGWFMSYMRRFAEGCQGVLAVDGKTMRHSFDRASKQSALHLVSAWVSEQRLVLAQLAVDSQSNEIPAVRELLGLLALQGMIVS